MGAGTHATPMVEWINHAGFLLECGSVSLVCDPWLSGTAFNGGWRLMSDSVFGPDDFSRVTHIWFSHQHPDHFAPSDLRRIPAQTRARITVLYHPTIDKKVVRFCKSLGFKAQIELTDRDWYPLDEDVALKCGVWFDRDSWLAIRTPQGTILNANDCVIDSRTLARQIVRKTGPVRLLLTQFSYADYQGDPQDVERQVASARDKLERIMAQADVFDPEMIVPFASYMFWCKPENFHLNFEMNRASKVAQFIEERLRRTPIVLYPGERWRLGEQRDWSESAARYDRDIAEKLDHGPSEVSTSVPLEALQRAASHFLVRLRKRNPLLFLTWGRSTRIHLYDLAVSLRISHRKLRLISAHENVDIEMHSESLLFCLKTPWGSNALAANGRFRSPHGRHERFFVFFKPADWADHGYRLSVSMLPLLIGAAIVRAYALLARRFEADRGRIVVPVATPSVSTAAPPIVRQEP